MKYLLDTHALLWALYDSKKLSDDIKNELNQPCCCVVSIASLWEIAIKNSIGKLELKQSINEIAKTCEKNGIAIIDISPMHCDRMRDLPQIHSDPFDRIIIAQAQLNNYTIITKDRMIPKYEVETIW